MKVVDEKLLYKTELHALIIETAGSRLVGVVVNREEDATGVKEEVKIHQEERFSTEELEKIRDFAISSYRNRPI